MQIWGQSTYIRIRIASILSTTGNSWRSQNMGVITPPYHYDLADFTLHTVFRFSTDALKAGNTLLCIRFQWSACKHCLSFDVLRLKIWIRSHKVTMALFRVCKSGSQVVKSEGVLFCSWCVDHWCCTIQGSRLYFRLENMILSLNALHHMNRLHCTSRTLCANCLTWRPGHHFGQACSSCGLGSCHI